MTPAPAQSGTVTTAELCAALVHTGVGLFGLRRLTAPDPLFNELTQAFRLDALISDQPLSWDECMRVLVQAPAELPGPLGQLLRDYRLDLRDWFLLALAGETEDSHPLNLALALLQGPDGPPRPALHLCTALCDALFGRPLSPVSLASHPLINAGILQLDGDGPLPLCALAMPARLWAVLRAGSREPAPPWPGCVPLGPVGDWQLCAAPPARAPACTPDSTPDSTPATATAPDPMPAALRAQLPRLAELLARGDADCVAFRAAPSAARAAAVQLGHALGLRALEVPVALWCDEPALAAACRYGRWLPVLAPELGPGERFRLDLGAGIPAGSSARFGAASPIDSVAESAGASGSTPAGGLRGLGPLVLALGHEGAIDADRVIEIDVPPLTADERRGLWRHLLGQEAPAPLAASALLDGPAIATAAARARLEAERLGEPLAEVHLVRARVQLGAERLRQLAQPVNLRVSAEALVLPPILQRRFDDLVQRAAGRERIWDGLGVSLSANVSTGVRALFVGDSGTGKTLAAARLATCLDAPLYRVDLAAVMNKYIGESEKNLGLLLDAAAAGDVMLLLDEADALFGRRGEGAETGERFANMLTNFLLTRIETHPGIVVLTSNSRSRIDPAFTRRLDAILEFPLPAVEERRRLWRGHLGARSPGDAACGLLAAYCDLPGGHVRNAVLAAAARCPGGAGDALGLPLLVDALRDEYRKLGRAVLPQLDQLGRS